MSTTNSHFEHSTEAANVTTIFSPQVRDKIILITGVNAGGIGGSSALALAEQSPRLLILAGRSQAKVTEVIDQINSAQPNVACLFLQLDLFVQQSCRRAAQSIMADSSIPHIDIMINNAGVMGPDQSFSKEGIEMQFATNHIGHYLFTNLILRKLIKASYLNNRGATRIVNVSSRAVLYSPVRFSDLNLTRYTPREITDSEKPGLDRMKETGHPVSETDIYNRTVAYGQSKSANVLFSVGLNKRVYDQYGIQSIAVHPGAIISELGRHQFPGGMTQELADQFVAKGFVFKNLSRGASTQLVAALDPALSGIGNDVAKVFMADCQIADWAPRWATDASLADRLWSVSEDLVGEKFDCLEH